MDFKMCSDSTKNIGLALIKARADFESLLCNKETNMYKYADLNAILDAILPALRSNGLDLKQPIVDIDNKRYLFTVLRHPESQEFEQCWVEIDKPKDCAIYEQKRTLLQAYGCQNTYIKRYQLSSFFGLAVDKDSDGSDEKPEPYRNKFQPKPNQEYNKKRNDDIDKIRNALNGFPDLETKILNTYNITDLRWLNKECVEKLKKKLGIDNGND